MFLVRCQASMILSWPQQLLHRYYWSWLKSSSSSAYHNRPHMKQMTHQPDQVSHRRSHLKLSFQASCHNSILKSWQYGCSSVVILFFRLLHLIHSCWQKPHMIFNVHHKCICILMICLWSHHITKCNFCSFPVSHHS